MPKDLRQLLNAITLSDANLLARIAEFSEASSALMLVTRQEAIHWGKPIRSNSFQKQIESFQKSTDNFRQQENQVFLKPGSDNAVIMLHWNKTPDPSVVSILTIVPGLLSLIQEKKDLARLVEISQDTLRKLSEESVAIASRNTRLFEQFDSQQARLRSISKGVLRMQEEERSKISRELHDGIGQALSALKMNLDLVSNGLSKGDVSKATALVKELQKQAEQALEDVRELSRLLRPRMLDDLGLLPTLRWYVRNFSKRTGIRADLQLKATRHRLDRELQTLLFRIIQEGLNNILKHSKATTAKVKLSLNGRMADLEIIDNGAGFDPSKLKKGNFKSGSGIAGIRDRVTLADGTFDFKSAPGSGTTLKIQIPIAKKNG